MRRVSDLLPGSSAAVRKVLMPDGGGRLPGVERVAAAVPSPGTVLQTLPGATFYAIFFLIPLAILFVISFWRVDGYERIPDVSLENYATTLTSPLYQAVLVRTVAIGAASAAIVVPVCYVLAYVCRFTFTRRGGLILGLVIVSLFSGYLVRIYSWRTILGREGLLNTALLQTGVIDEPITFLIFSQWAIIITLVGLLIPIALLPLSASMANVSHEHLEVARDLGSTGWRLHRTIVVPMVLPGLSTAFALAFMLAAGDFVVPAMVGGTEGGSMVGSLVANQFKGTGANWPLAAALAFLILSVFVAVYALATRGFRALARW